MPGLARRRHGTAERLTRADNLQFPGSFSPDGRWLAYSEFHPGSRWDIWLLRLAGDGSPDPFLTTPFDEFRPAFSPDGTLMAYVSNEAGRWDPSGRWEVYVRPLGHSAVRLQVSTGGGGDPRWSADGRRLYYRQLDRLISVPVYARLEPALGEPRIELTGLGLPESVDMMPTFDLGPGERFLVVRQEEPPVPRGAERPIAPSAQAVFA